MSCCPADITRAAEPLQGAAAVLEALAKSQDSNQEQKPESEADKLKKEFRAFAANSGTLAPEAAAKQWLALVERVLAVKPEPTAEFAVFNQVNVTLRAAFHALPGPAVWPELRKQIEARPAATGEQQRQELGLRFIAHRLANDREALIKDLAEMEKLMAQEGEEISFHGSLLKEMAGALLENGPAEQQLQEFEKELALAETDPEAGGYLRVPDLVALVGEEKARPLLRRALLAPQPVLPDTGLATIKLARTIALEAMDELKVPVWGLAHSVNAWELFEALEKKFPRKSTETNSAAGGLLGNLASRITSSLGDMDYRDHERVEAEGYYVLALIQKGEAAEAVKIVQRSSKQRFSLPYDGLAELTEAGFAPRVFDFIHELLSQNPDLPLWDDLISTAATANQSKKPIALIQSLLSKPDLSVKNRANLQGHYYRALLADDQVDAGIKALRESLGTVQEEDEELDEADIRRMANKADFSNSDWSSLQQPNTALQLARLGHVLNRPELVEEGLKLSAQALKKPRMRRGYLRGDSQANAHVELLLDLERYSEAENLLLDLLLQKSSVNPGEYGLGVDNSLLIALTTVYHRAGRHGDVLLLLERAPQWGVKDLIEVESDSQIYDDHGMIRYPLAYMTAAALAQENRPAEALKLIQAALDQGGSHDPSYELYLKLAGTNALAQLDLFYQRDQFQERPLIWKAQYLKNAGKLVEAEAAARLAISVDPSDGEQKFGQRMRVYSVLADIKEAGGDAEQARFFREVVQAIRISEKADEIYQTGLLRRGVEMYREALKHFSDAYCIQSRLAIQLSQLGLHEAAEAHYRKAFELMPDSFGRVETHCFGCEGAFNGQQAQNIAEQVFTELAAKNPTKPQLHYLLGYLRMEQGRFAEAMASYRQAVELDPLYLNAWVKIIEMDTYVSLSIADKDAALLALLRLDPLQRHSRTLSYGNSYRGLGVSDLAALWRTVEATQTLTPPVHTSLYPLPASAQALAELSKNPRMRSPRDFGHYDSDDQARNLRTPAQYVSADRVLANAARLMVISDEMRW